MIIDVPTQDGWSRPHAQRLVAAFPGMIEEALTPEQTKPGPDGVNGETRCNERPDLTPRHAQVATGGRKNRRIRQTNVFVLQTYFANP